MSPHQKISMAVLLQGQVGYICRVPTEKS